MISEASGPWKFILSILFFPLFFQNAFLSFVWGHFDNFYLALAKRVFLLLPASAVILACWVTMAALITTVVRQNRSEFIIAILATWWDLGKAIFAFWGGIFKFVMYLTQSVFGFIRLLVTGLFLFIADLFFIPFRVVRIAGINAFSPGIPWIAVLLTIAWTLLEATIFTFVTSGLVIDTLSNMTGEQISEKFIRAPLFLFMLFIVLGSYSVLLTLTESFRTKNIPNIIKIGVVELVAMFVEVVFLYREFVDALVPWFAQHSSKGFDLGIGGTLAIAAFTWVGVRSLSWFLFAAHGTPVIMSVIQGRGLESENTKGNSPNVAQLNIPLRSLEQIKQEMTWIASRGDEILGSFVLPPLQILAGSINFCTLLITGQHLFELPLDDIKTVMHLKPNLKNIQAALRKSKNEKKASA